jgi:N-sulfoglucosamine sulfohydrolase
MDLHRSTRREFLEKTGLAAAAVGASRMAQGSEGMEQKRNILLYVVDDQGTDDAGCYGNSVIRTPGLDYLAENGTRFTHAFCTTPSCSASRSVILSGKHNHATGQYGHAHAYHHFVSFSDLKTLPVYLDQVGYRTLSAGKYHVAPKDVYDFQGYVNHEMSKTTSPIQMADEVRPFIAAEDDRPFFLYFCTCQPHRPFLREGMDPVSPDDVIVPPYLPDSPSCRDELAKYYGSVQLADRGLLRLTEILEETGHWKDTLIIYVSDNGIAFPGAKTCLYEPGMRLPCVVRNPFAERRGVVNDAMVTWADITPTILDFAGALPEDGGFHGRSFLNALEQDHLEGWDEIHASHTFHEITMYFPMRVVRQRRFKLIWNIAHGLDYPFASDLWESTTWQAVLEDAAAHFGKRTVDAYIHRPAWELYDLENDPDEVVNLAGDPHYTDTLDALKANLKAFQERTGDPWIVKWEHE